MMTRTIHTDLVQIRPRVHVAVAAWTRGAKRRVAPPQTPHGVSGAGGRAAP